MDQEINCSLTIRNDMQLVLLTSLRTEDDNKIGGNVDMEFDYFGVPTQPHSKTLAVIVLIDGA